MTQKGPERADGVVRERLQRSPRHQRKSIPTRVRFEVFKRDGFACTYCGRSPPSVVLQIDHIDPVAEGGANARANLVTACEECNSGKGAIHLRESDKAALARKALARTKVLDKQVTAYNDFLRERRKDRAIKVEEFTRRWREGSNGWGPVNQSITSIERFLDAMPEESLYDAMEIAFRKLPAPGFDPRWSKSGAKYHRAQTMADSRFKYFCGICWKWIKEKPCS